MCFFKGNCNCGDNTPVENNVVSKKFNGLYHIIRYNADDRGVIKKGNNTNLKIAHNPIYNVLMSGQPIDVTTELRNTVTENDTTIITGNRNEKLQLRGMFNLCGVDLKRPVDTTLPSNHHSNGVFWLSTQNLDVNIRYKLYVMCNVITVPYNNTIRFHLNSASDTAHKVNVKATGNQLLEIDFTNKLNSANMSRRSFTVTLNGCKMDIIGLFYAKYDDVSQYRYSGSSADIKITENDVVFSDDLTAFDLSYNVPIERATPIVKYQNINPTTTGSVNNDDFNDFYSYYKFCQLDSNDKFVLTEAKLGIRRIDGVVGFNVDFNSIQVIMLKADGSFFMPVANENIGDIKQADIVFLY